MSVLYCCICCALSVWVTDKWTCSVKVYWLATYSIPEYSVSQSVLAKPRACMTLLTPDAFDQNKRIPVYYSDSLPVLTTCWRNMASRMWYSVCLETHGPLQPTCVVTWFTIFIPWSVLALIFVCILCNVIVYTSTPCRDTIFTLPKAWSQLILTRWVAQNHGSSNHSYYTRMHV